MDKEIYEAMKSLLAKSMRLEARCDALATIALSLGRKVGFSDEKILERIEHLTEMYHQKRLERAEGVSPELAAEIDYRPELPELPDELLDS